MVKPLILYGKIEHGKGLGKTVGMPTANLRINDSSQLPEYGVYATRIFVGKQGYDSVTNIGMRPSVDGEETVTVETYILDFADDIYGEEVQLEVYQYLRPTHKFHGIEEVQKQVEKDVKNAKKYLDTIKAT